MKIVSLIPARGGSKGIPNKNLIDLCGKPLLQYAIEASKKSQVNETWVSSDDDKIIETAKKNGAYTLKRPNELATDEASSESVLMHFSSIIEFDILVFIQATSPLISSKDIDGSIANLDKYDSVVAVTENTQLLWTEHKPLYDLYDRPRRQDLEKTYLEVGSLFVTKRENLVKSQNRLSGSIKLLKIPKKRSFDIDTLEDLDLVRILIRAGVLDD